jgi:GNAT superfamily N-acetyltransferase
MIWHVDLPLARRIEAAEAANGAQCATVQPGSAVAEFGDGRAVFMGVGSPLTHALGLGLDGPFSDAEMHRLEDFFVSRGNPPVIDLCPLAHPSLQESIAGRGYRITEFNNEMVRAAGEVIPYTGIDVRQARPDEERLWSRVLAQGFLDRDEVTAEEMHVGEVLFRLAGSRCYFALVRGEAIGAAALVMQRGVAILFADSTRVAWRGRGAQVALIAARLERAHREGCDVAASSVLPGSGSQRNYERLGFRVAYTKVVMTADRPSTLSLI